MSKLNLFIPLVIVMLSSCKKNYTCLCNTEIIFESSTTGLTAKNFSAGLEAFDEKLSKKQAKAACNHMEGVVQTNVTNWYTVNGKYDLEPWESITTNCELTQ